MKKNLLLILLFITILTQVKAQNTIVFSDGDEPSITMTRYAATDATGHYIYSTYPALPSTKYDAIYQTRWNAGLSRWEIIYGGSGTYPDNTLISPFVEWYSTVATTPYPPNLSYGSWKAGPDIDGPLVLSSSTGDLMGASVSVPTLTTTAATTITATSAVLGGNISTNGGATLTARGIVYVAGTTASPIFSTSGAVTVPEGGTGTGAFTQTPTTFSASTTYHYQAYATNSQGTSYGGDRSFTTSAAATSIVSINRLQSSRSNQSSVTYSVTFSGSVTGVTTSAFSLTTTGITGASLSSVSGSGTTYTVTVNTGTGDGTIRLDASGSGIAPTLSNTPYTSGQVYTIDKTAPVVTLKINNGATATNNTTVNLSETATDADATLQMRFSPDGGNWSSYETFATTKSYTMSFVDEDKTIYIQVIDQAGNVGSANATITLDKTAPNTTITANPAATSNSSSATFQFTADEVSTFEASLDSSPFAGVTSAKTYTALSDGSHTFQVRATDAAGNVDATPATYTWTIDATSPTATITSSAGTSGGNTTTSPIPVTVTFSETVTGFTTTDVAVTNGSISNFAGSGATYTFNVTPAAAGDVTVNVPAGGAADAAANNNTAATQYTITYALPAPAVTSVSVPANGTYKGGETLSFTVNTSQSVTVTGTPRIALTIGTSTVYANFSSGSGTSALIFTYTVQDGDLDNNGIAVGALALNGGSIRNNSSTDITLSLNNVGSTANINVDAIAPSAPSTPDMTSGTDSGILGTDNITNNTTPVFTGTAEANSTVKLYNTDGTSLLGQSAADGSGNWSITSSTLAAGSHTITAKATDGAGNTGSASSGLAVIIDNAAPTGLALNSTQVSTINATNGLVIATISATDATTITYSFAVGNGTNDADNGKFSISSTSLKAAQNLTAGTYHIYLKATDAAGNNANQVFTIDVIDAPSVTSIVRASAASAVVLAATSSVDYSVTFSQAVTGVDASDFTVNKSGSADAAVGSITGSGDTYTVTVNGLSGDGNIRLDLNSSGTGIQNGSTVAIANGYTSGQSYTLDHTAPSLSSAAIISDNSNTAEAKIGDKVALTFTASETIPTPIVTIAGHTVTATNSSGNIWAAGYTLVSGDTEGTIPFTINFADAVGNAATAVTSTTNSSTVTFDKTAPTAVTLVYASNNANSAVAKIGDVITLTFIPDEQIQASTVSIGGHTVTATNTSGNTWTASYTETSGDTDGRIHFSVSFTDLAGNTGNSYNDVDAGDEIIFDKTAPTLSTVSIASNNTNTSAAKTGDVITVSFTGSETIGTPSATIAGVAATVSGSGTSWTATHTISGSETEGAIAFNVSFNDIAGNQGTDVSAVTDGSSVVFDNTPPTVSIGSPSVSLTTTGPVTFTITYNDGTVTLTGSNITLNKTGTANATAAVTGTGLTRTVTLSSITGDGSIGISLASGTAKDGAGNPVAAAGPSSTFRVYNTAPSNISLSSSSVDENQPSATTVGSFSSTGTNTGNGDTYTYSLVSGTGSDNNAQFTIDGSGNLLTAASFDYEGVLSHTYSIRVKTTDAAGLTFEKVFTISIDNLNDAPVAVDDSYATIKNVALIVNSADGILGNDTDADGDALTAILVTGPSNGSLTLNPNGSLTYTPATGYTGSDSFTYKVNDGTADGNTATVTINIGNPVITLDAGSLTAMATTYGTASDSQSFTVSGTNLTAGILVTPPAGYELSTDNSSFAATVTLASSSNAVTSKTVYIRLKAVAAANTYAADNVVLSSTGASSVNVPTASSVISRFAVSVTANNATKTYGEILSDETGSVKFTPSATLPNSELINTVDLAYGTGAEAADAAVMYNNQVTPSGASGTFNAGNYDITYVKGNIVVDKRTLNITATGSNKTYDGSINATATLTDDRINSDVLTINYSAAFDDKNAGDNKTVSVTGISISGDASGNYALAGNTATTSANIAARTINVTAQTDTRTYDGTVTSSVAPVVDALQSGDIVATTPTQQFDNKVAGTGKTLTASGLGINDSNSGNNYSITYVTNNTGTISPAAVTITADMQSKTYGDTEPTLSYQITSGALVNGDAFTGGLARDPGEAAGSYAIKQGTLALSSNYNLTYVGANLTIGKKAIMVTADVKSKIFGQADPALTYQVTSGTLVNGDAFNGALNRDAGEAAGSYAIKQGTLALSSNYTLNYTGSIFTITAQTTATLSNLVLSQGAALSPVFSSGIHNYTSTVPNTVTAIAITPTVTDANAIITVNGTAVASGMVSADLPLSVGSNTIAVKVTAQDGTTTDIYKVVVKRAASTVATLSSVTAGNGVTLTTTPGSPTDYTAEVGYDVSTISLIPTATDQAATIKLNGNAVASGSSTAVPLIVGLNKAIIVVTAQNGAKTQYTVTITRDKGDQSITFAALAQTTYGDNNFELNATSTNASAAITYSSDNANVATVVDGNKIHIVNAGTANITAKQAATGTFIAAAVTRTLTVKTAAIEVSADAKSKPLGSADPVLTYSITGGLLFNGDLFTGKLSRDKGETAGSYNIKQGTLALSSNYVLTFISAKLVIGTQTLTITANDQSKIYGQANPKFTLSYSGFVKGDDQLKFTKQPVITTTAISASGAGTYAITVSGAALPGYIIKYVKGTLTVNKADLSITADNKIRAYGAANPKLTLSYDGFVNGDTKTSLDPQPVISTAANFSSAPGNYPITVDGGASANYSFSYVPGTLTVLPLSNAALTGISISSGTLSPAFVSNTYSYTAAVGYDVGFISVTPAYNGPVKVTINGMLTTNGAASGLIALSEGDNTITLITTAQDGVTSLTYTITIHRAVAPAAIVATNVLSPNGDGKNDGWVIKDIKLYPNNTVTVYDRAGRVVYSKQGYNNDWNGTLRGAPLTEGTYFYIIDLGPQLQKIKGYITVLSSR